MRIILLLGLSIPWLAIQAQSGTISGTLTGAGVPLEFATILVENSNIGTTTDEYGNFKLQGIEYGTHTVTCSYLGFSPLSVNVELTDANSFLELDIVLTSLSATLHDIVVSGTRTAQYKKDLPVAVQVLTSETFENTQSACLAEGLSFQPGLRMETDCQTCNYTQLRINGLGGGYSQILINSRPIFSALNGLYGLEQIPANMIEQVEVVRGGGSALFGSSAIAGTVNIITKKPDTDSYKIAVNHSLLNGEAHDNRIDVNVLNINENKTAGISVFAARRQRQEWDANGDQFSEIPRMQNTSFGIHSFLELSAKTEIQVALNFINEQREGGDQLDKPPHQRQQSESRNSQNFNGTFDFNYQLSPNQKIFFYSGFQNTDRTHYTGVNGEDGYGTTDNYTVQSGLQYNLQLPEFIGGTNSITMGVEQQLDDIFDEIPAYSYLVDQRINQWGYFAQSDWKINSKVTLLLGGRLTKHSLNKAIILTPRASLMYSLGIQSKIRASYGRGFRAPQAFDADLHIAFAGGGVSTIQLSPDLRAEFSDSYTLSWDFDHATTHSIFGGTISGFYTRLYDSFILEEVGTDLNGNTQLEKRNGGISEVIGITLEARTNFDDIIEANAGFTFQKSTYDQPVAWSATIPGTTKYLRTPDNYGFYTLYILSEKPLSATLSGVFTGPMLVPHFGGAPGVDGDRQTQSESFWETNFRLRYQWSVDKTKQIIQFFAGVQNVFNAYQSDFDIGPNRDSNYVYGPARPRTFFFGIQLSSPQ